MQQGQDAPLVIYGAGGHGLVVADAAIQAGWQLLGFLDDERAVGTAVMQSDPSASAQRLRVIDRTTIDLTTTQVIVGIGDNRSRSNLQQQLVRDGAKITTVVHPSAVVSPRATLASGVYVGPRAVVNIEATLADGVIVNSAAVVEHHCQIGAYAHIGPGAVLAGGVRVGEETLVGARAAVKPGLTIGKQARIGAGAVVLRDVLDGETAVGVVR